MSRSSLVAALSVAATASAAPPAPPAPPVTPNEVVAAAPPADWAPFDPGSLLILELGDGRQVAIALAPAFAPIHVANIRAFARAGWFDGSDVVRVQDNYVVQWGGADERRALPAGVNARVPAEYDRPAAGLKLDRLPYRDTFASAVGYVGAFPAAQESGRAWAVHCYGMVGVGRDMNPDTGTGAELYAVIGHAPRQLDRNIALVGRVVAGFEHLTALPRGTGDLGFYKEAAQRLPIRRVRLAADLPAGERPAFEWLRSNSASFADWVKLRANRRDGFFLRPAGAVDLCGAMPPVRPVGGKRPG